MRYFVLIIFGFLLVQAEDPVLKEFVEANIKFTADVYREVAKSDSGNILISPISVSTVLALAGDGARGNTASQISASLHLPSDSEKIKEMFRKIKPVLQNSDQYVSSSANKIYVKNGYTISDSFKSTAVNVFSSAIENIDFFKNEEAAFTMNKWVEEKTYEKIKNLINPNDLNNRTRLVLINAMYFKATWLSAFMEYSTSKKTFYINKQNHVDVPMMAETNYFNYYECPEVKATFLEMPYAGDDASMTFVLPNDKEGLPNLEAHLDHVLTSPKYKYTYVDVQIPKFKIEATIDFKSILESLGVVDAFDNDKADFKGIAADESDLKIDKVVQKTFIEINEDGTTAAAGSGLIMGIPDSIPPLPTPFIADHPFIYFIKIKDVIIFAGRCTSPVF